MYLEIISFLEQVHPGKLDSEKPRSGFHRGAIWGLLNFSHPLIDSFEVERANLSDNSVLVELFQSAITTSLT